MDWVTPKELEAALIDKCGSRLSILNAICGRVEMDLLRVEADRLIVDGAVSSDASYLKRLFGLRDRLEGSWNMGDIGGTLNRNRYQFMKVQAFGVRFSKDDAEAMGAVFNKEDARADASARQEEPRIAHWYRRLPTMCWATSHLFSFQQGRACHQSKSKVPTLRGSAWQTAQV